MTRVLHGTYLYETSFWSEIQILHGTYIYLKFISYLKFKYNRAACVLSGNANRRSTHRPENHLPAILHERRMSLHCPRHQRSQWSRWRNKIERNFSGWNAWQLKCLSVANDRNPTQACAKDRLFFPGCWTCKGHSRFSCAKRNGSDDVQNIPFSPSLGSASLCFGFILRQAVPTWCQWRQPEVSTSKEIEIVILNAWHNVWYQWVINK